MLLFFVFSYSLDVKLITVSSLNDCVSVCSTGARICSNKRSKRNPNPKP